MILNRPAAYDQAEVYRLRPGTRLVYGDPVEDWTDPQRVRLRGVTIQVESSEEEDRVDSRRLDDERVLFAPRVLDLTDADRVEIDGEVWKVHGRPLVRRGLSGSASTRATLTRDG